MSEFTYRGFALTLGQLRTAPPEAMDAIGPRGRNCGAVLGVFDIYDSGPRRITGTVKNVGTPANTPVQRRVRLHEQYTGRIVREAWSDPVSGAYQFSGIAPGTYYVIAFDHTGQYSGVTETDIAAEPMP